MKWIDRIAFLALVGAFFIPQFMGDLYYGPDGWTIWLLGGIPLVMLRFTIVTWILNRRCLDQNRGRLMAVTGRKLLDQKTWFLAGDHDLLEGFDRGLFGLIIVRGRAALVTLLALISFFLPGYYFLRVPLLMQALVPYRGYLNPAYLTTGWLVGWSAGTVVVFVVVYAFRRLRIVTPE